MKLLTIGQVARQAGVGVETVRYYEREGLLEEAQRRPSGYRQFDGQTARRLKFIRRAKELGFTLKEIKELLSLKVDPSTTCADVRERAEHKLDDIQSRIDSLKRMKRALVKLTRECNNNSGAASECPILDALDGEVED